MKTAQEATKEIRRQMRKEGRWKFPAAFAAAMLGLSVFISLLLVLDSRENAAEVAREAKQEAVRSNQRIGELQEQTDALLEQQKESNRVAQEIQIQELEHRIRSEQGRDCFSIALKH